MSNFIIEKCRLKSSGNVWYILFSKIIIVNNIASSFGGIISDMEKLLPWINVVNRSVIEINNNGYMVL